MVDYSACVNTWIEPNQCVLTKHICVCHFAGKNFTAEQLADSIGQHIAKWQQQEQDGGSSGSSDTRVKTGTAGSQEGLAQR